MLADLTLVKKVGTRALGHDGAIFHDPRGGTLVCHPARQGLAVKQRLPSRLLSGGSGGNAEEQKDGS